jgi:hypothetical protein
VIADCETAGRIKSSVQLSVTGQDGRVTVEVARPGGGGGKLSVEYGDETYNAPFEASGRATINFVQTEDQISFSVLMSETKPIPCKVTSPEFKKFYRVVIRWHDPIVLGLNMLEPGGQYGGPGHIFSQQPNAALNRGLGRMDVDTGVPDDGSTGEMSYVVSNAASIPANSVIGAKVDYVTRGSNPEPPYCDNAPLATPEFYFITIIDGKVRGERMAMNRAPCQTPIPANRRLMPIR